MIPEHLQAVMCVKDDCNENDGCCPKLQSRGEARKQAMLDAAAELFLEKGFSATSLSEIVSRSKGSRATLYKMFGNKEGLLLAMIDNVTSRTWRAIDHFTVKNDKRSTEQILVDIGVYFVANSLQPATIAIFRIFAAENNRMPEEIRRFLQKGPIGVEEKMATIFHSIPAVEKGLVSAEAVTKLFLGLVNGNQFFHEITGLSPRPTMEQLERQVRLAVDLFLHGVNRLCGDEGTNPAWGETPLLVMDAEKGV